jgi:hypothetical protein
MTKTFCDVCGRNREAMFTLTCQAESAAAVTLQNSVDNPIGFKKVDICDSCLTVLTSANTVTSIAAASIAATP